MKYQNVIKKLREELVLSQVEFAELLGVSFSTVNRWEKGYHEPTIKIKRKINELCKNNNVDLKRYNEDD